MGRPQFETVVASAPRKQLSVQNKVIDTALLAGKTEYIYFYAPENTISKIISMRIDIPGIATATGNHMQYVLYDVPNSLVGGYNGNVDVLFAEATGASKIEFLFSKWRTADVMKEPSTDEAQAIAMTALTFDSVVPLTFAYKNGSSLDQTGTRIYLLTYETTTLG
jgi:hypothetical protein